MANPYHKRFNLLAFVLLAGALYINFVKPADTPANRSKSTVSKKAVNSSQPENKVYLAKAEEKK